MFTEDSSDLSVGLIAAAVAGLLLIPIIVLYSSLMNSGLELNADMNHGGCCSVLSV
jgi:hypothetical protein